MSHFKNIQALSRIINGIPEISLSIRGQSNLQMEKKLKCFK